MTSSLIVPCLIAAMLEMDTTYAVQSLVSRPIIAGPILGWLCGDILMGVQVGIFAELLLSDVAPLGGIIPPSGVTLCTVTLVLNSMHISPYFGFFCGVICAIIFAQADIWQRKTRSRWIALLQTRLFRKPADIKGPIAASLGFSFLIAFLVISVLVWISARLAAWAVPILPPKMHVAFGLAYMAVPWIGLAALLPTFRLKTR